MSRSTGFKDTSHPCRYWIKQSGDSFVRYDKDIGKDVVCNLNEFLILDYNLMRVVGFNKGLNNGVLSNEVRSIKDHLSVYTFLKNGQKVIHAEGPYSAIKDRVKSPDVGGKYAQSVYIAIPPDAIGADSEEPLVIANICVTGGTLEGWLEWFNSISKKEIKTKNVGVSEWTPKKNGNTNYFAPVFKFIKKTPPAADQLATTLDGILQEYLNEYLSKDVDVVNHEGQQLDRQASSGHESQEVHHEDDDEPSYVDPRSIKLKDGRMLGDLDVEELKEMLKVVEPKLGSDDEKVITIKKVIDLLKPKGKVNPFASEEDDPTFEEDDDIPF